MYMHEDIEVSFNVKDESKIADDIRDMQEDNPNLLDEINFTLGALVKLAVMNKSCCKVFMDLDKILISKVMEWKTNE